MTKTLQKVFSSFLILALALALMPVGALAAPTTFSENFDSFTGSGFSPTPTAGQLDSDDWRVTGLSDGDLVFGGTGISGDYARGVTAGGVTTGGIYSLNLGGGDFALAFQPSSADLTPGSLRLKIENTTGSLIPNLTISYDIVYNNDQGWANSLNFAYSALDTDGGFTPVAALDFTSPETADTNGFQSVNRTAVLPINLPDGSYVVLSWTTDDVSGSGSRDELGINNVSVSAGGTISITDPVINEFSANTTGDDVEYLEFYGDPNTDYSAFTILAIEGDSGSSVGQLDDIVQTLGTTDANGYYLISLAPNTLENGSLSLLLVEGFTGGSIGDDLDTDDDGTLDVTPWSGIVDSVGVHDGGGSDLVYAVPVLDETFDDAAITNGFAPGGASRIPDGFDTNANTDWVRNDFDLAGIPTFTGTPVVGEAYNTPGAANAVVLPQVVINEIIQNPAAVGDSAGEWFELYNAGSSDVDINGWTIADNDSDSHVISNGGPLLVPAGGYLVLGNNTDSGTNGGANVDYNYGSNWFLANGADEVVLFDGSLNEIDRVEYDGGPDFPDPNGASMSLIDPALDNNVGANWCEATTSYGDGDSGTPGAANVCADAAPVVENTYPVDGTTDFPIGGNLTVTFSEPVDVSGAWFNLSCSVSGAVTATVSGGPTSFTLDPDVDLADGESCTLTVYATNVTDQDAYDPPNEMEVNFSVGFMPFDVCMASYTPIYDIQGSGLSAAITGSVTTQGIVVGDYEGSSPNLRGFYLQDVTGDGDAATSDGIFVFNFENDNVSLGDVVRVTGSAGEFQDQTQISSVTSIANCGTGSVAPVDVELPVPSATYLEQFEGMLVRFPQTLYVTEHFQLGRFGQVVLSSDGRLQQPTNVVAPGAPALALQAQNDLNRIILDDELNNQNPDPILFGRGGLPLSASNTLRGGDTVTDVVGIMTYTWAGNSASGNAYRLRPVNALGGGVPDFQPANPRPASAPAVGGTVKVVGMNLLNFFNTFDGIPDNVDNCSFGVGGLPADCRGADTQVEFDRQYPKTVAAILSMDADVIGFNEIENDGYGPDSAIAFLVDQLNAATAPGTYALIDADAGTGQVNALGTDAIKVGLIYQPASVTPVGQTAALNTVAFVNGGDSDPRNRPSLAQAFEQNANGQRFIVAVNHFKSKGSACDDDPVIPADGQGNCNIVRVNAATELMNWLASDPTGTGDPDVLLIGDYNSYAMEDPITYIRNTGFTNLISSFVGPDAYSYVFDGQWGYLDHALGSASILSQITGVDDYHINADEPATLDYNTDFKSAGQIVSLYAPDQFRLSDHDPVMIGLCQPPTLSVSVSPESLWPANHKYVDVEATLVASGDVDTISSVSITSNEPDDGLGDGDTADDIVVVDNDTFKLRAERSGNGSGRVYTITYTATNTCGASVTTTATVTVPKSQGKK